MRPHDLRYHGPVRKQPDHTSAYDRMVAALERLKAKLETADDTSIGHLPRLLDEMAGLCDRALGAALLLKEKCK